MVLFEDFLPDFHLWLGKTCCNNDIVKQGNCVLLTSLPVIPQALYLFQVKEVGIFFILNLFTKQIFRKE